LNNNNEPKIALVTGGSSGIGASICRLLAQNHYHVIAAGRNKSKLDELVSELGDHCYPLVLDVTNASEVARLIEDLPRAFQAIDVLVNNAGHDVGGRRSFEEGSVNQWTDIVETNVQGMMRVTHAVIDGMLTRNRGHIINMGSIAGLKPYATGSAYVTSKYAVHGFSESLRLDFAGRGIRVTEIMPGLVRTGFAEQRLGDHRRAQDFYDSFEQCLQVEDIAATILYALNQPAHVEIAQMVVLPVSSK
jgi:3-hydroxy acid dehydrogenase/malonic semialdehyde reductase